MLTLGFGFVGSWFVFGNKLRYYCSFNIFGWENFSKKPLPRTHDVGYIVCTPPWSKLSMNACVRKEAAALGCWLKGLAKWSLPMAGKSEG